MGAVNRAATSNALSPWRLVRRSRVANRVHERALCFRKLHAHTAARKHTRRSATCTGEPWHQRGSSRAHLILHLHHRILTNDEHAGDDERVLGTIARSGEHERVQRCTRSKAPCVTHALTFSWRAASNSARALLAKISDLSVRA